MVIRLLVAARRPMRPDDFEFETTEDIEVVSFVRRLDAIGDLADREDVDVALIDASFHEGQAFAAMTEIATSAPGVNILALTPSPPEHGDVARSVASGASGFVDVDADPTEFADAVRAVHQGGVWFPDEDTRIALRDIGKDLELTASEQRSRLFAVLLGVVPLVGALAAVLALLFRQYLGHVGVRPVDIAIDPTSRLADTVAALSMWLGIFGALLYVKNWIDLLVSRMEHRSWAGWLDRHRGLATLMLSIAVLVIGAILARFADLVLILIFGPIVAVSLVALALGANDELPAFLQIKLRSTRAAIAGGIISLFVLLSVLSSEALIVGPQFDARGVDGVLAPRFFGFGAHPVLVTDVSGELEPRERLYLGGNADLYVLVDPCNDNAIEMVSVGSSRIDVIAEVSC
mgnify:FL=1